MNVCKIKRHNPYSSEMACHKSMCFQKDTEYMNE